MGKTKSIIQTGNSVAVTLSSDELAHLHRALGDKVTIDKWAGNRLVIKPAAKRTVVRRR